MRSSSYERLHDTHESHYLQQIPLLDEKVFAVHTTALQKIYA